MKTPKDSLLLIDGHAVLYRAFHAIPPLQTADGTPTNAVYGFITTLFKALEELKPKYCAVAFDLSGPTFRHQAFEGYKANRAPTPDALRPQIAIAQEVVKALDLPIFTAEGYEADDVIGTLAKQAKKHKTPVIIVTGDKDSFQLVDDSTFVYTMKRTIADTMLYDAAGVKERMGVLPKQIPDYKALAGDASDEIPGISGIGDKTAVGLLQAHESIDKLYETLKKHPDQIGVTPRILEKLKDGETIARQSLELATIDCHAPIELRLEDCTLHTYNAEEVINLFQKLEFFSLIKRLPMAEQLEHIVEQERDWTFDCVTDPVALKKIVAEIEKHPHLVVDTETDDLHGPIVGLSFASNDKHGYYVPLIPEHGLAVSQEEIADILRPLFENAKIGKIGHNIKYDMHKLRELNIELKPIAFDTMVAAYVLHAHLRNFDFDTVCQRELGYTPIPLSDLLGKSKKEISIRAVDIAKLSQYAAEDAVLTYRLYTHFRHQLAHEEKLKEVAETLDFPLICVLENMENRGVKVDVSVLHHLEKEIDAEINSLSARIQSYSSEPININSPQQLQKLLFDDLKLAKDGMKTTQKGTSTAASELEKLQGTHPVIDGILRYREVTKLQSTYIKILPTLVDEHSRIHTQFSQTTAATGRLSSSDPNLQNIPIRTELGEKIRTAFVTDSGWDMISLDYSQLELRIIAHLSGDQKLQEVFLTGRDVHDEVAKAMGIDRRAAKAINFGIIYGLSAFGLSQALKIDPKVAKQYIDTYFATYSDLARYLEATKREIRTQGYVETLFGRRREIPEIQSANAIVRAQAERMAMNAPTQGTEADLMKLAMIFIHEWIEQTYAGKDKRPYLILQVHDEFLLECPKDMTKDVATKVKQIMENVYRLDVPLVANCEVGHNWGEMSVFGDK